MKAALPRRGSDCWGSGKFGARRGYKKNGKRRYHKGVDYLGPVGTVVYPFMAGIVTKLGYCYSDDLSFRYVRVTDKNGYNWRYLYLSPLVKKGMCVSTATPIGKIQTLQKRHPADRKHKTAIPDHCHLEIKYHGKRINPNNVM